MPRVAFLGPRGTFTEEAVIRQFGSSVKALPCGSLDEVFHEAASGTADFAVVPVENSTEGIVTRTADLLLTTPLKVIGEVNVAVHHNLMNRSGKREDIVEVHAHPQALAQCQNFINKHFSSGIEQIEKASTSRAAQELINLDESYAAIANKRTAELFKLNVLAKNINDEPDNKTRFIMLSRCTTTATDSDKTSIAFATKNQPGALVKVLNVFDALNINLSYIDSRPSKKNLGEYVFFVDFEGHITDDPSQKVLDLIRLNTNYIKILGSYRKF